ncbi:hypothetical protein AK830_g12516 [Neonectria ditissima]|uniref:Ubiquitin-like protease family profile domain-containing protein n=1 Tax=Neonectria ditissima TaxID=78410 RepID=A0A0P7B0D1_9HYPO|nr:hypothetical protein AK830_g12516 [Neonectria ditissima]
MSSSPLARYGVHTSADSRGFFRPSFLKEAPAYPRPRIPAVSRAAPQQPPTSELPLDHIPTSPRPTQRPNSRFLIDTPGNHPDSTTTATATTTTRTKKPRRWTRPGKFCMPRPLPNTKTTPNSKPDFIVINGSRTRKRPAQSTEIELVASNNGIHEDGSPIYIRREGRIIPIEVSDQETQDPMRWELPQSSFLALFTRMISSVYVAVSGLTGRIGRWINPLSYEVAEFRSYVSDNQVATKRVKLSHDEEDAEIRWIDRNALSDLIDDYKTFAKGIGEVWESIETHHSRQEMNKALEPIRSFLADNENDRAILNSSDGLDLCELFALQFKRVFENMDRVYEIGIIVKLRDTYQSVPPTLDYELSPLGMKIMNSIKKFLSAPALPTICKDILRISNKEHVKIFESFIDVIILDLEAITHNIPAPSYVLSRQFHDKILQTFPHPERTDLDTHLLLPGAFPTFEEPKPQLIPIQEHHQVPIPDVLQSPKISPVVGRPKDHKPDFMAAKIAQLKSEEYREHFYHESEAHRVIKDKYITEFSPKVPITVEDVGAIKSILKNHQKHPSRYTPKRLGIRRPPKAVRFTDSTLSPTPRTRLGREVPRIVKPKEKLIEAKNLKPEAPQTQPTLDTSRVRDDSPETQIEKDFHTRVLNQEEVLEWSRVQSRRTPPRFRRDETGEHIDPGLRIRQLLSIPSIKPLEISDDSKAGITFQKEQAALKAAEEARQVAEAARREAEEKARRELEERLASSGGLRVPARTLVGAVPLEWQTRARDTLRAAASTTLATTGEGVDLRRHDFAKVVPATEWLNDEIVNGSLNWLDQAINSAAGIKDVKRSTRKCLAMSSFFFKRLQEQGVARTQRTLRRYGVEKKNLLDVDTILLPICERSHWTLLVIRPSKKTVAHMDSLNPRGNTANTNLALAWMKDVLEENFLETEWKVMRHEAPRQTNGYDCGVHTITNAMCIALGLSPIDSYAATDMPEQRIRLASMLLNGGFKGEFDLRVY